VQLAPTDSSAKAAPPNPCSLVLDYPPSASPSARWGYGQPTHRKLHDLIAAHDETYHAELQAIAGLAPELVGIELSAAEPDEPSWINDFLPGLDGAALYAFVRTRRPRRYLEIGSGNSTKFVARAKRDGALATKLLSVDPHPRAEIDRLCDVVIRQPFETIGLEPFAELDEGDIVFFDGSHRTFTNSDATVFFLEVLPMLAQGILVGVHDIYLPDDYPPDWNDRYYSEQYLLACYLLAGCAWLKPVLASWYASSHPALRLCLRELWANARMAGVEPHGGAFWMLIDR
jgi:predicted O-methyltransferase YrrM